MRFGTYLLVAPLLLAGCAPTVTDTVVTPDPVGEGADACGAEGYQQFVGEQSPAITLPAGTVVRHYRTGDPVTMDFNPQRINFEYDRRGVLVAVRCG